MENNTRPDRMERMITILTTIMQRQMELENKSEEQLLEKQMELENRRKENRKSIKMRNWQLEVRCRKERKREKR